MTVADQFRHARRLLLAGACCAATVQAFAADRSEFLEVVKRYRDEPPAGDAFAAIPASDAT